MTTVPTPTGPLLPPEALDLARHLHAELLSGWERLQLPARWAPEKVPAVPDGWQAAPVPDSLRHRRAELIVAASDAAAITRGLEAGADAIVLDLDDVFSPRAGHLGRAYANFTHLAAVPRPFLARLRPLAHREARAQIFGQPAVAALLDLAAYTWAFRERETVLYLPKLDTVPEATFWGRALDLTEEHLGLPPQAIRVCLQIETLPGLLNAEALLHELRGRAYGLNAGRWDYVFSVVKHLGGQPGALLPTRAQLGMNGPAMQAYALHVASVCRRYGAQAIGGTAAAALTGDAERDRAVLEGVRQDKAREAAQGFVAAWAGSPELLDAVRGAFGPGAAPGADQHPVADHLAAALQLPRAESIPAEAVQDAIGVAVSVLDAWLRGVGEVARPDASGLGRSEDTATAELSRAQLWHWRRQGALQDADYLRWRRAQAPDESHAAQLLDALVLAETCAPYFPAVAEAMFPEEESDPSPLAAQGPLPTGEG